MCWINAYISYKKSHEEIENVIKEMNKKILHRGPDDHGTYVEKRQNYNVWLWQVRLSIIDLSKDGHQPMHFEHKETKVSIVFNWEIYNFQQLKNELKEKGYKFKNKTDTEVIMAAYIDQWIDCVKNFNWMWSFVLYDHQKGIIFCSRDVAWEKPLYYHYSQNEFIASSEIKGIISANRELKKINKKAVEFYCSAWYIPAPHSIYKSVYKLEARHSIIYNLKNKKIELVEYFKIPEYKPQKTTKNLIQEGKEILRNAVKIRTFADVPVGAFLSGGVDSSSIVSEMKNIIWKQNLHTFSIGFRGKKYDETKYIDIMQKKTESIHHHYTFTKQNFKKLLQSISYFYDEPFGDYSSFPTMYLAEKAKEYVTVALTGDWWDEVFGGYRLHQLAVYMNILYRLPTRTKKCLYLLIPKTKNCLSLPSRLKEAIRIAMYPKEEFYSQLMAKESHKSKTYNEWTIVTMRKLLRLNKHNIIQSIIDFDLYYNTLPENFLTKVDRGTMKTALECRAPFLDPRFLEFSKKIPVNEKVSRKSRKILLKKIVKDLIPTKIINRKKMWFHPPIDERIMEDQFEKETMEWLKRLYTGKIISNERYAFYTEKVFKSKNLLHKIHRIRLYMFINRYNTWIGQTP